MLSSRLLHAIGGHQLMRTVLPAVPYLVSRRLLGSSSQGDFESAQERVKQLSKDPGNEVKLKLYALFKQSTIGICDSPKPGMMEFVAKAKWTEWKALGNILLLCDIHCIRLSLVSSTLWTSNY